MRERFVHDGRLQTEGTVLDRTAAHETIPAGDTETAGEQPASEDAVVALKASATRKVVRYGLMFSAATAGAVLIAVLAVYALLATGFGEERLRQAAEDALTRMAGREVTVTLDAASISISRRGMLVLQTDNVAVADSETGNELLEAGTLEFTLALRPLLGGQIRLGEALISDARLDAALIPSRGDAAGPRLATEDGLIDPDLALEAIFGSLHRAFDAVESGDTRQVRLENVTLSLPRVGRDPIEIAIAEATLTRPDAGQVAIEASAALDGRPATLTASATRQNDGAPVEAVSVHLAVPPSDEKIGTGLLATDRLASLDLQLAGNEGDAERLSLMSVEATAARATLPFGEDTPMVLDVEVSGYVEQGADKLEIARLEVASAGSTWLFDGAIGPTPAEPGIEPSYRFELVSERSLIAPPASPEPALEAQARFAGRYFATERRIDIAEIGVAGDQGELTGRIGVQFGQFGSPGLDLDLNVRDMPVGHVKQFWPWFAAHGARSWVYANILDGHVEQGRIRLDVLPDRFGHGIPLDASEVNGTFTLRDGSFRAAGDLPTIHEAIGTVRFAGSSADIELSGGRAPMPSGREIVVGDGTFAIRRGDTGTMIGSLDIGVSGAADAAIEFAGHEPLNAGRYLDMAPEAFSGTMSGRVVADIPLRRDLEASDIDWLVALDFAELGLARQFEGQTVTEATGSITIDPETVVIDADVLLNGIPAKLNMVEPFGETTIERSRAVSLALDDGNTERLAPGLSMLLSGMAAVEVRAEGERQEVGVDLATSELSLPWVGWRKGQGIPASASFFMAQNDGVTKLEEFALRGDSFAVTGEVALGAGGLSTARFDRVSLNRTDNVAVDITRRGEGYEIGVSGAALDARSLVKYVLGNPTAPSSGGQGGGGQSIPLDVKVAVARVTGFHGEVLSDVVLNYRGRGSTIDMLELSAVTDEGKAVAYRDGIENGQRRLQLQSDDAGSLLRFLDVYERMDGGTISAALGGPAAGPLSGQVDARNFWLVNEPRLSSLVSTAPEGAGPSLNQAVRSEFDTSRVQFDRGASGVTYGKGFLALEQGVLRGPQIGSTFQGTVYDQAGNMAMTGTFMPAYGLNRIFGEIPILGQILGNGRDRGLIGITFRLYGKANAPQLQVNPLSVVAPGIFRSVFEFR
jgi:hypothetical protein